MVENTLEIFYVIIRSVSEGKDITCNSLALASVSNRMLTAPATGVTNEKEFLIPTYRTFKTLTSLATLTVQITHNATLCVAV